MSKYFLVFIILTFIGSFTLNAQLSRLDIEHITEKNGLSNNRTENIVQDTKGFIWIATSDGLCRYDGYEFQIFKPDPDDPNSICGNIIRCIDIARNGDVWVGTDDGISCYNQKTENFTNYTIDPESPDVFIEQIECIEVSKSGNVWFRNQSNTLSLLEVENNKFHYYVIDSNIIHYISNIIEDSHGNIWISTNKGLSLLLKENISKGEFINYSYSIDNPLGIDRTSNTHNLYLDRNNNVWFINQSACKIDSFNNKQIYLTRLFDKDHPYNEQLKDIHTFHQSIDGKYWLINTKYNLFNYDPGTGAVLSYAYSPYNPEGLSNTIENCYCDNSGVMWIASAYEGIYKFSVTKKVFKFIHHITGNPQSLKTSLVFCISEYENGEILLGSNDNFITKYNPKSNTLEHIKRKNSNKYYSTLHEILYDSDNNLWLAAGTLERLISKDQQTGTFNCIEFRPEDNNPFSLKGWNIYCLTEDNEGNIWIPIDGSLSMLPRNEKNNTNPKFKNYFYDKNNPKSLLNEQYWDIFTDNKDNIWIGTNNGLSIFNPETGLCEHFFHSSTDSTTLSNDNIKCIHESRNGIIWLGTEGGGLNRFNEGSNTFTSFRRKHGLPNEIVWGILEDKNGKLWLNTNAGISCFNPKDYSFKNYPVNAEGKVNHYGKKGFCKTKNGTMYFTGLDGIIYFHPDSIKENNYAPPIVITKFKIFNKPVDIGKDQDGEVILTKSISETEKIKLSWRHNSFSFEFTSLDFTNPQNNKYAYKMEGFDEEWVKTDASKRYATYTNLNAGKYTFRVKGTNSDGVWNNNEAKLIVITITPPFWETLWFRIGFFIFLILGTYLAIRYRINSLKKQRDELESTVKERTIEISNQKEELRVQAENLLEVNSLITDRQREIEKQSVELMKLNNTKDKFFSIIAHDLKNPFHAISGMSSLLNKSWELIDAKKKKEFIQMIEASSKGASTLLENLLQWSRTQTNQIKYKPSGFNITEIINETINLLLVNATKKRIKLSADITGTSNVFADQNMITTVIRNLINNAIKFTREDGEITILGKDINGHYEISVIDNGIGMSEKTRVKLFNIDEPHSTTGTSGEGGTGLGLIICKEFVEKNGGTIKVESKVDKGSTFIFTLPKE